jgi:ribose transport system ATP-binding protein
VSKVLGGSLVLDHVDLIVPPGSVHALIGANGAGKSTIIKILSGYHHPDPGWKAYMRGVPAELPLDMDRHGVRIVHQDLAFAPDMTVLENLLVSDHFGARGARPLSWRRLRRQVMADLARVDLLHVRPDQPVRELAPSDRALLAICRADRELRKLDHAGGSLIVLDEPLGFLSRSEAEQVLLRLRELVRGDGAVLLVSHRLGEIRAVADGLTVLRNGSVAWQGPPDQVSEEQLATVMFGLDGRRDAADVTDVMRPQAPAIQPAPDQVAISWSGLTGLGVLDASADIGQGEILGITGLAGSGFDRVPYLVLGVGAESGSVSVGGRAVSRLSPGQTRRNGVVLVPGDRGNQALWPDGDAFENTVISAPAAEFRRGAVSRRRERRSAAEALAVVNVTPLRLEKNVAEFSGGNQQKIVLARCLYFAHYRLMTALVTHEITQGIDANSRHDIFSLLRQIATTGVGVLVATADYEALAELCDRVIVMREGRIAGELTDEFSEEDIALACGA